MIELAHRLLQAKAKVDRLDEELKAAKQERDDLKQKLLEVFAEGEVQSINCGGSSLYLKRQVWARPISGQGPELNTALKSEGLDALISESINANKLSAWVREMEDQEKPIPSAIQQHIHIEEVFDVGIRKG